MGINVMRAIILGRGDGVTVKYRSILRSPDTRSLSLGMLGVFLFPLPWPITVVWVCGRWDVASLCIRIPYSEREEKKKEKRESKKK